MIFEMYIVLEGMCGPIFLHLVKNNFLIFRYSCNFTRENIGHTREIFTNLESTEKILSSYVSQFFFWSFYTPL